MGEYTKGRVQTDGYRVWAELPEQDFQQCIAVCHDNNLDNAEKVANANLIVEAFRVANETGRTPRQLADERTMLLLVVETLRKHCADGAWPGFVQRERVRNDLDMAEIVIAKVKSQIPP